MSYTKFRNRILNVISTIYRLSTMFETDKKRTHRQSYMAMCTTYINIYKRNDVFLYIPHKHLDLPFYYGKL